MNKFILCAAALFVSTHFSFSEDTIPLKNPSKSVLESEKKQETKTQKPEQVSSIVEKPYVAVLETYGSPRVDEKKLRSDFGNEIDKWVKAGLEGDPEIAQKMQVKLQDDIRKKYDFAIAEWSILQYFEPGDLAIYITLDVVDKSDIKKRMPFERAPKGKFQDPDGLIQAWLKYEQTAFELLEAGELDPSISRCNSALHCPFGHEHPKLKPFEKQFEDGVKKHADLLIKIQAEDARTDYRAAATYLLPYLADGNKIVSLMLQRIKDPEALVRNNAMRVLGDIAEFHPKYKMPVDPLIEALDFPYVSDQSKALYTLYNLTLNSEESKKQTEKKATSKIIQLLSCAQPNHRDVAVSTLRKISGKNYAATDFKAWKSWAERLPAQVK